MTATPPAGRFDLVIIGLGSGGMVAAEFAAGIGLRVAVIERGRPGGDCLWTGCVPSKALIASAKAAHTMRSAHLFGLPDVSTTIDTGPVWTRIRAVQDQIARTDDDPARFEALGVDVVRGDARITSPQTVRVTHPDGTVSSLDTRRILICTGSRPAAPDLPGLSDAGFLTSENVFELDEAPESVCFIGGGPIAIELAQAFARLGVTTTVLQQGPSILPREEPDLVAALGEILRTEGVAIHTDVEADRVTVSEHGATVRAGDREWTARRILVAAGRRPNTEGLGLEEIGVEVGPRGIVVDNRMRTAVPSVYAAGDVAGRFLFTHSAAHEAVRAVRDMAFPGKGTVSDLIPWCTFTEPELAHVGMTEAEARQAHGDDVEVWQIGLDHSDRARTESAQVGLVKVITTKGKVIGGHILGPSAGELIHEITLAIHAGMQLKELAFVHVYPTMSSSIGQLGAEAAIEGAKRFRWLVRKERG
ncbi:MAG: FAD-dependent oxidoreductase [Acidimicrobiales bacterium]